MSPLDLHCTKQKLLLCSANDVFPICADPEADVKPPPLPLRKNQSSEDLLRDGQVLHTNTEKC